MIEALTLVSVLVGAYVLVVVLDTWLDLTGKRKK